MPKRKKAKNDPKIMYQYRPHGNEQCSKCVMYVIPNECTDVAGYIRAAGWCKIFARKK